MELLLSILGLVGVFVFALSGALAAVRKDMDMFGVMVLALMPAIGGGTIRDLVLDVPVFWIQDSGAIWAALLASLLTLLFSGYVESRMKVLVWADAVGLALFSVLGAAKALSMTDNALIAIMLGVTTGVAGGIVRDVICNEVPFVLRKTDVYATAAFVGAGAYCALIALGFSGPLVLWSSIAVAFILRAAAIIKPFGLPGARKR